MMVEGRSGKHLSLDEIQAEETRLLAEFAFICETNGLRWWLAYGSCLGAIRHGGPIPWDDDLDVYMPRSDFEQLRELAPVGDCCRLLDMGDSNYAWGFGKFVSTRTGFKERMVRVPEDYGVFIDVFPLDGVPVWCGLWRYTLISRLYRVYQYAYHFDYSLEDNRSCKGRVKQVIGFVARLIPASSWRRLIGKMASKYDFENSSVVTNYFSPYSSSVELTDREHFRGADIVSYAGAEYPVPADAEGYLRHVYGSSWRTPIKRDYDRHGDAWWRGE